MNAKLAILQRRMERQAPEKPPAPETGLGATIEAMINEAVEEKVAAAQQKPSAHVQRLLDQQFQPKTTYTDYRQIPPTPRAKIPSDFEAVVQRDRFGRISKMISKPINGEGPTFEMTVTQRDENGRIARLTSSVVDDPSTPRV